MKPVTIRLEETVGTSGLFKDGDWVESKDQDSNGNIRLIQLADIGVGVFKDKSNRSMNHEKFTLLNCTELIPGDILIARMPDPIGRACIFPGDARKCATVVDIAILRVDPNVAYNRYVMHCINTEQTRNAIENYVSGTTRKRISRTNLGKITINLPSLEEQKRIADKLDLTEQLEGTRQKSLEKLELLTQSIFLDMFGDPTINDKQWDTTNMTSLFKIDTGKLDANAMCNDGEYPFFTCAKEIFRIDKYAFDKEALLLSGNNASGDFDVKYYKGKFNAYQRTYILELKDPSYSYKFFGYHLKLLLNNLKQSAIGSNTRYLTLQIMERVNFIIPPVELQRKFDKIMLSIDTSNGKMEDSQNKIEHLFASINQKVFSEVTA